MKNQNLGKKSINRPLDPSPGRKVEKSKKISKINHLDPRTRGGKVEKSEKFNKIDHLDPSPKVEKSKKIKETDHLDPPRG